MKISIVLVALCLIAATQARYYRRTDQQGQQGGQSGGGSSSAGADGPARSGPREWARLVMENVKVVKCLIDNEKYEEAKKDLIDEFAGEHRDAFENGIKEFESHVDNLHQIKNKMKETMEKLKDASDDELKELAKEKNKIDEEKKEIRKALVELFEQVPEEDAEKMKKHFEEKHGDIISDCVPQESKEETQGPQEPQGNDKREYKELFNVLKALINKRK